jgi:hypothetical protein
VIQLRKASRHFYWNVGLFVLQELGRNADGMAAIVKKRLWEPRTLVGVLALAAATYLTVGTSPSSSAQAGVPWRLGRIGQAFVWAPRVNVVPAIDSCAVKMVEMHAESPEQACLLRAMQAGAASSKAVAFARWYYTFSEGDSAFIYRLLKSRFGVVSIAEIELPGRANTNSIYIFVNGIPAVINPEEGFTTKLQWTKNAAFLAIKRAHPNAGVFPNEDFVGESVRPNGGQRFTIAAPIVDGCHACARVGIVYIGFDFGPFGSARAPVITAVHRCPTSDARCEGSFAFATQSPNGKRRAASGSR